MGRQQQTQSTQDNKKKLTRNKKIIIVAIITLAAVLAGLITLIVYLSKRVNYDDTLEFEMREGCSDFYYNRLSENQQKMYRMLYREAESVLYGKKNKKTLGVYKFSNYGIDRDEAETVWYAFRYDAPEFFIVSNAYLSLADSIEVPIASEFTDGKAREKVLKSLSATVEQVGQLLTGIDDNALKFKVIYDYVIEHTEYKRDADGKDIFDGYSYSIAGPLDGDENTKSICQGYARAVSYLCNLFGIECIYVGSGSMNHAVNIVKIDGEWYYADATFDNDTSYGNFLQGNNDRWKDICKESDNSIQDKLIARLPKICDTAFKRIFCLGDFTFSIQDKNSCSIIDCNKSAESVVVPSDVYGMQVSGISASAFINCSNLTTIKISQLVNTVGNYVFNNCASLTTIDIQDGVEFIADGAFADCGNLVNVSIPLSVTSIGKGAFSGCGKLTDLKIPDGVISIGQSAFEGCSGLTSIKIPDGVTSLDKAVFKDCANLTSVDFPKSLESIGSDAFNGCANLTSIDVPKDIASIGERAFKGCVSFTSLYIPSSVAVGTDAFQDCENIKTAKVPACAIWGMPTQNIQSIVIDGGYAIPANAFKDNGNLASVELSNLMVIGDGAFSGCNGLTSIKIPSSVSYLGKEAFRGCENLKKVEISDNLTGIEYGTFWGCSSLISVNIPQSVSSIERIAFENCSSLTSINIPDGVTSIGNSAFAGCSSLKCEE